MPIRPERKHLYPANWKTEIVPMIRARSGNRCERCQVENGATIQRAKDIGAFCYIAHPLIRMTALWCENQGTSLPFSLVVQGCWSQPIRIMLTVAHLNHDETDNRPENLAHLCQLHHNRHDAKHRAANAKARRERDKNKADGQTPIVSP